MKALFIGRFQPFHKGHLAAHKIIEEISPDYIIAIGSPKVTKYFSLNERIEMIVKNTKKNPIIINDLPKNHKLYNNWGKYVLKKVGDIQIVATGNESVKEDFLKLGKNILFFRRENPLISGTIIRELIEKKDMRWKDFVPKETRKIIMNSNYFRCHNE